jgi:hypothetical protein
MKQLKNAGFLSRNLRRLNFLTAFLVMPVMFMLLQKLIMVNFKFAKFHCYQQTQSFLITPHYSIALIVNIRNF